MSFLSMPTLAEKLCLSSGVSVIVVDCWNNDDTWNSRNKFPSLDDEQLEQIGKPFAIEFSDVDEARTAYETLCRDTIVVGEPYSSVGGRIHLFERTDYKRGPADVKHVDFPLSDYLRPVHVEHGIWTTERIEGREA